jgi:hypothetical protein
MKHLSKVKRFTTQLMFLSNEDKQAIRELLESIKGNKQHYDELKKEYEA